jgi:hypothetical protein
MFDERPRAIDSAYLGTESSGKRKRLALGEAFT